MHSCIAILGPESTGKSRLAAELAECLQTRWIPEYARDYLSDLGRSYTINDVEHIAYQQFNLIKEACSKSDKIVIADTEMLVCSIWTQVVFGETPQSISSLASLQQFDLYLLCDIDLPWEADPLREHPHRRQEIFDLYHKELLQRNLPYEIVKGSDSLRLENAMNAIKLRLFTGI